METNQKVPMRNILILGIVAAALYIVAAFYDPYQSIYLNQSILFPVLVTIVTILPLVIFFWIFFSRVTVPALLRAGSLTAAIGGTAVILFQIYEYSAWLAIFQYGSSSIEIASLLVELTNFALHMGILLIGVAFLRHPNPKFSKAGLCSLVAGGIGCLYFFAFIFAVPIAGQYGEAVLRQVNAVLPQIRWVPLLIFLVFLIALFLLQPKPVSAPAKQPPVGGGSPYDNIPHY